MLYTLSISHVRHVSGQTFREYVNQNLYFSIAGWFEIQFLFLMLLSLSPALSPPLCLSFCCRPLTASPYLYAPLSLSSLSLSLSLSDSFSFGQILKEIKVVNQCDEKSFP